MTPLWPLAPRPYADELLASWLSRVACRYGLSAADLQHAAAPRRYPSRCGDGRDLSVRPRRAILEPLAHAARIPFDHLSRLRLAAIRPRWAVYRFSWRSLVIDPATARLRFGSVVEPAWCPICLAEDRLRDGCPYLRQHWAYALSAFCYRHRRPLQQRCEGCGHYRQLRFVADRRGNIICCGSCGRPYDNRGLVPSGAERLASAAALNAVISFARQLSRALDGWHPDQFIFNNTSAGALVVAADDIIAALVHPDTGLNGADYLINDFTSQKFPRGSRYIASGDRPWPLCSASPEFRARLLAAALAIIAGGETRRAIADTPQRCASLAWLYARSDERSRTGLLRQSRRWPPDLQDRLRTAAGQHQRPNSARRRQRIQTASRR